MIALAVCVVCGTLDIGAAAAAASPQDEAGLKFFEQKIRPVLIEHCHACHSAEARAEKKLKGGLLLDTREGSLRGGDTGPSVVPGDVKKSLLVAAIVYDDPDLQMPPKKRLPESVIADFRKWIEMGAPDPREGAAAVPARSIDLDKAKHHWAFQPLRKPAVPAVAKASEAMARTAVDAFLLEKMDRAGVKPAPLADPRTLIRRVSLDLTGLPPTPQEVEAFVKEHDAEEKALAVGGRPSAYVSPSYARLVDRLLASPQYGERWGRHWLDVARYAETQGYERDENKPFAWRYRDWVIDAFNSDMPYLQFVREQVAGDELADRTASSQIATGFLRVGTFDTIAADGKMARYDSLDDTLGVTVSAFLAQTIQCARCHDHKFEPLSQEDYFRLLAAFEPLSDPKDAVPVGDAGDDDFKRKLAAFEASLAKDMAELDALRLRAIENADLPLLAEKKVRFDARRQQEALAAYRAAPDQRTPRQKDFTSLEGGKRWDAIIAANGSEEDKKRIETLYNGLKQRSERDKPQPMLAFAAGGKPQANERSGQWPTTKLMIRGEVHRLGADVRMGVPQVLLTSPSASSAPSETKDLAGGRRLWLADWMTQSQRPLLARVIVNRVWQQHFGRGFVSSANELGVSGGTPSHPELLEWLAADFVEHGWKIKRLHRLIVTSAAYQLSSRHPQPQRDVEAGLYSRWKSRRLEAEAIRDSILTVSGRLNGKMHGPSIYPPFDNKIVGDSAAAGWQKSDESEAARRSVYIYAKRAIPLPELEILNSPDSSVSMPRRQVATTSVQALLLLNGKLVAEQAAHLAARVKQEAGEDREAQVRRLWLLALSREPRGEELAAALEYLNNHPRAAVNDKQGASAAMIGLCQVVLNTNEFVYLN